MSITEPADAAEIVRLWPEGPPSTIEGVPDEVAFAVEEGLAAGTTFLRNISDPTLTVFSPPEPVPPDAPPLFTAVAHDDILRRIVEGVYLDWSAADRPAELHVYRRGFHGFGMIRQGTPSDGWTDLLLAWLEDAGFTKA